jgi:hypothetical protein
LQTLMILTHPIFWISMLLSNFDILCIQYLMHYSCSKSKKHIPNNPWTLQKLWRRGAQNATFSFGNMFPTTLWHDDSIVFFLLKTLSMISSFWSIWNHTPTIGEFVNQAHIILGLPNFQYLIFLVHLKLYNLRL